MIAAVRCLCWSVCSQCSSLYSLFFQLFANTYTSLWTPAACFSMSIGQENLHSGQVAMTTHPLHKHNQISFLLFFLLLLSQSDHFQQGFSAVILQLHYTIRLQAKQAQIIYYVTSLNSKYTVRRRPCVLQLCLSCDAQQRRWGKAKPGLTKYMITSTCLFSGFILL